MPRQKHEPLSFTSRIVFERVGRVLARAKICKWAPAVRQYNDELHLHFSKNA
jgi:hypothetical protein